MAPSDRLDCSKVEEVLDELGGAQGISAMNDKYKIATNSEDQVKRCAEMTEAIKTLRKYNNQCYTSLTQQILSAILRTRTQFNDMSCKDPASSEFKNSLEAAKCASEKSINEIREAEKKTIVAFQVLHGAAITDDKLSVRRACCAVLESKKLFIGATKEKCAKYEKNYSDYVDSYTDEAMGLICPVSDKLECDKLETIKSDGVVPNFKFFLTPMVKLVKTLDH